jgi:hypothetical protein
VPSGDARRPGEYQPLRPADLAVLPGVFDVALRTAHDDP